MDPLSKLHLQRCEREAGSRLVGVGIWGDGAPYNWDRSESVEVFTMNLPGLSGKFGRLRIPIVAVN